MEISERVRARLAVLSGHLSEGKQDSPAIERWCTSADTSVAPLGSLKGTLTIVDERTGKNYKVPVSDDGTVKAVDFKKIVTGKEDKGLKLYDPGYLNTAPVRSSISYIDGDEGILRYRGYPIEEMAENSTFLEVAYLLMYGNLPSESQLSDWEFAVSQHSAVPQGVLVSL
jgi:citrate synthase